MMVMVMVVVVVVLLVVVVVVTEVMVMVFRCEGGDCASGACCGDRGDGGGNSGDVEM